MILAPRNAGAGAGAAGGGAAQKTSTVLYGESEELNRVVILTLARAIHIHGYEQQSTGNNKGQKYKHWFNIAKSNSGNDRMWRKAFDMG